ncbi:hypothetical protein ACMUMX_00890 [Enterobacter mori]|jgi:hypothetical protein|uniref:hypothetical protein n=1 Tax=Enterobacter mori TaxID=539813 RepID=UPI00209B2C7A|nr:hypothetical protein [Enterobacter mori]EKX7626102.1 hypothetical protein [Enterobacter mori]EME8858112.1 hypothetical protein [Enterobacter mori]MCO7363282.1 hypothetical protein [Enterobacter mori]
MTIVFIPALVVVLLSKERETGRELTQQEVEAIRDSATAIRVPVDVAKEMIKERGYLDIDPEDVWEEWLLYKKYVK